MLTLWYKTVDRVDESSQPAAAWGKEYVPAMAYVKERLQAHAVRGGYEVSLFHEAAGDFWWGDHEAKLRLGCTS